MIKVILWGAGRSTALFLETLKAHIDKQAYSNGISIVGIIDSNRALWGSELNGYIVLSPEDGMKLNFDKIVIPSEELFDTIKMQIMQDYHFPSHLIDNIYFYAKEKLIARYAGTEDQERKEILSYLQNHPAGVFNYTFKERYHVDDIDVIFDQEIGLFYVKYKEKRLYMSRRYNTEKHIRQYVNALRIEQDKESPHCYMTENFCVRQGDIVVDVGAAEGNFALEIVDRVSELYLVESDVEWVEALQYTFRDYRDKVTILHRCIADSTMDGMTRLDDLIDRNVDFIKMDIEGSEAAAIDGAEEIIKRSERIRIVACTYHNNNDAEILEKKLQNEYHLNCNFSKGYMWLPYSEEQRDINPSFRKGVIRAEKV